MNVLPLTFNKFHVAPVLSSVNKTNENKPEKMIETFCNNLKLPNEQRNYCDFDNKLAEKIASYKDEAVRPVLGVLKNTNNEKQITAGLLLLNRIIDAGAQNVGYISYPIISRFNYNPSHNVQVMLAGIYRKTLVPDAFGPLVTMFVKNVKNPVQIPFDPNEEVGGAILEYLRNTASNEVYKN